jgi:hypothetical protein
MGEVYRAKDTKLGRDNARKILPASLTNDPERVARFRREAQVLAALSHPRIAQIYGLEDTNGTQFLALELVDGESLNKRIARGPIPVDEAVAIAKTDGRGPRSSTREGDTVQPPDYLQLNVLRRPNRSEVFRGLEGGLEHGTVMRRHRQVCTETVQLRISFQPIPSVGSRARRRHSPLALSLKTRGFAPAFAVTGAAFLLAAVCWPGIAETTGRELE